MEKCLRKVGETLRTCLRGLLPCVNGLLARLLASRAYPHSVLHVSYMVHIPYYTVQLLRQLGMRADYLAVGTSQVWSRCDYRHNPSSSARIRYLQEFLMLRRM